MNQGLSFHGRINVNGIWQEVLSCTNSRESHRQDSPHQKQTYHWTYVESMKMTYHGRELYPPVLQPFSDIKVDAIVERSTAQELLQRKAGMLECGLSLLTGIGLLLCI